MPSKAKASTGGSFAGGEFAEADMASKEAAMLRARDTSRDRLPEYARTSTGCEDREVREEVD